MSKFLFERKWWVFVGAGLMIMLANFEATIVALALPTIARSLDAGLVQIQWVTNAYLLSAAAFFAVAGRLADLFTTRRVFIFGSFLFCVASAACALSTTLPVLIAMRFLQGIGFAFTLSLAILLIKDIFPPERQGYVLGLSIAISGASQALGPSIGGTIIHFLSWHWIFWLNVPFSLLAIVVIRLSTHKEDPVAKGERFDMPGAVLLVGSLALLIASLNQSVHWGISSWLFLSSLIGSFVLMGLFYWVERRRTHPLLALSLCKIPSYVAGCVIRLIFMLAFVAMMFLMPLYLRNILGYGVLQTSAVFLCMTVLFGVLSPFSGRWQDRIGVKKPTQVALVLSLCGFILFALSEHSNWLLPELLLGLAFMGVSTGIWISSTVNAAISATPAKFAGVSLGLFYTLAFLGAALGVAIAGSLINVNSIATLQHQLTEQHIVLSNTQFSMLRHIANGAQPMSDMSRMFTDAQAAQLQPILVSSFQSGFTFVMWIICALLLIGLLFTPMMPKREQVKEEVSAVTIE